MTWGGQRDNVTDRQSAGHSCARELTLEERAQLLAGESHWKTHAAPSADIPSLFLSDGPHGLRKQEGAQDCMGIAESRPATCFPTASALACSFDPELVERVGAAIELTLEERAQLLAGESHWKTHAAPSADIPSLCLSDGPHGLRKQEGAQDCLGIAESRPATCFPTASALACSFDPELVERVGAASGEEARRQGVDVVLGPGVNIKRHPLCGRNFEYFSEDPVVSGELGAAMAVATSSISARTRLFRVSSARRWCEASRAAGLARASSTLPPTARSMHVGCPTQ